MAGSDVLNVVYFVTQVDRRAVRRVKAAPCTCITTTSTAATESSRHRFLLLGCGGVSNRKTRNLRSLKQNGATNCWRLHDINKKKRELVCWRHEWLHFSGQIGFQLESRPFWKIIYSFWTITGLLFVRILKRKRISEYQSVNADLYYCNKTGANELIKLVFSGAARGRYRLGHEIPRKRQRLHHSLWRRSSQSGTGIRGV